MDSSVTPHWRKFSMIGDNLLDLNQNSETIPFRLVSVSSVGMSVAKKFVVPIEIDLLILSFLGHFSWEFLQAPLFSSLDGTTHFAGILICLKATLGDLGIALTAYWITAIFAGSRRWISDPNVKMYLLFVGVGLVITIGIEYISTEVLMRWSYAPEMPRISVVGTGLAPVLQWMVVPTLVFWYLHRLAIAQHSR